MSRCTCGNEVSEVAVEISEARGRKPTCEDCLGVYITPRAANLINLAEWKHEQGISEPAQAPRQIFPAQIYRFDSSRPRRESPPHALYDITSDWPEEKIGKGDVVLVRCGEVRVGELIAVKLKNGQIISRLLRRETDGTVELVGSSGRPYIRTKGEYQLLGEVVLHYRKVK